MRTKTVLAASLLLMAASAGADPVPFEILGFGAGTTGGYGGQRVVVTTLEDLLPGASRCPEAPCSLRHAVSMDAGPRHIRFAVTGQIVLETPLAIWDSDLTIDGSTAPAGGVQITNREIQSFGDNIILTHLKLRGMDPGILGDCLWIRNGSNVVVDHVSAQFCNDEAISASGHQWGSNYHRTRNVTVQHSLVAWTLTHHGDRPYSSLFDADVSRVSLYRNAFVHNAERNPAISAGLNQAGGQLDELRGNGQFEIVENVIYDYHYAVLVDNFSRHWAQEVDVIGNLFLKGPSWLPQVPVQARHENPLGLPGGPISVYLFGNVAWSRRAGEAECRVAAARDVDSRVPCAGWERFEAVDRHRVAPESPTVGNLLDSIVVNVGARKPCRDWLDSHALRDITRRSGRNLRSGETVESFLGRLPQLERGCAR